MKETVTYKIDKNKITDQDREHIIEAGEIIKNGGLVAFPTETVYGLGGNALSPDASKKIYEAKGRPSDNPLIAHISHLSQLEEIAYDIPEICYALAEKFWPGPLTMVLKKKDCIPYETTGGLDTVAVRMPDNKVALLFIEEAGVPIAAPSANRSGRPSPTVAEHVYDDLNGRIEMILDGGPAEVGVESTIVDLTGETPTILRPGFIDEAMLLEVVNNVERDPALDQGVKDDIKPKAPGMKYRHYAPKGEMTIVYGEEMNVVNKINELAGAFENEEVGIITTEEHMGMHTHGVVISIGNRNDVFSIAHSLYFALRKMDEYDVKYIFIEGLPEEGLGYAVMNRMKKAAGGRIIYI